MPLKSTGRLKIVTYFIVRSIQKTATQIFVYDTTSEV